MKFTGCIIIIVLLSTVSAFCQHQDKNWYFGTGTDGIIFDANNIPVKVSNKYPNVGFEGIVVVSDPWTGELLFYTDGINVIDKNHNLMTNGTGLLSNLSGSQCVQACKFPDSCNKYYVISNSSWDNTPGSFYYSVVDFTSNPLGQVTTKNQLIGGPDYHQAMRIIPKKNSNNYWLIGHLYNTATYHIYEITPAGFTGPVVYNFNNDGRSWAMEYNEPTHKLVNMGEDNLKVTLFDFDPLTGIISNEQQLASPAFTAARVGNFSPDGSKIYAGASPGLFLWQYDFLTGVWTNMNTCCYAHDVKTGPDGLTYHIHTYNATNPLGVMTDANLTAVGNACGYSTITNPGNFNGQVRRFPEFLVIPDPPVANLDTITMNAGTTVTILPLTNDSDPQGDPITLDSILQNPSHGTIIINGNQIDYTVNPGFCNGTDTLIYLIGDDHCSYDSARIIIHITGPLPPILSVNSPLCEGTVINLSAMDTSAGNYSWTGPNGFSSTLQNPSVANASLNDSGYYYVVFSSSGCIVNDSLFVSILPQTTAAFTIPDTVCAGVSFSAVNNSSFANSFTWSFGDGGTSSLSAPSHIYTTSGSYTVQLITTDSCGMDTASENILVINSNIQSDFIFNLPPCDSTVNFINQSIDANFYSWYFGDGDSSSLSNPVHTYNSQGSYTVELIAYNICGTDTFSLNISVQIASATAGYNYTIDTCNSTVSFINTSTGAGSYHWNFGDGSTDTLANTQHSYSLPGSYTVTLYAGSNCGADSITILITVPAVPLAQPAFFLIIDSCSMTITCNNQSINASQFLWQFGDGSSDTTGNPVHTYSQPGTYNVVLWAANSCDSDSVQLTVTVNQVITPQSAFTFSTTACSLDVSFTNTSTDATSIQWNFGDGQTDTTPNPSHHYITGGIYYASLIAINACTTDTIVQQVDLSSVILPTAAFNFSSPGCDTVIAFNNSSVNSDSLLWIFGDGTSDTMQNPLHAYPANGIYNVILIASNHCGSDTIMHTVADTLTQGKALFTYLQQHCIPGIQFINQSQHAFSYRWNFGDGISLNDTNPNHNFQNTGSYTVTLIINEGTPCADSASLLINAEGSDTTSLFIPNTFTPNGDGINDVFEIKGISDCSDYQLRIYNRWGQQIFETSSKNKPWTGTFENNDVPEGVYYYVFKSLKVTKSGAVTVLR